MNERDQLLLELEALAEQKVRLIVAETKLEDRLKELGVADPERTYVDAWCKALRASGERAVN